jgi:WD40 repeat protein
MMVLCFVGKPQPSYPGDYVWAGWQPHVLHDPKMASPTPVQHIGSSNLSAPEGTYIYSIARASPTSLAAASSDDCLRTLDPATLQVQSVIKDVHKDGITCLKTVDAGILATGGQDGVVKIWDTRQPGKAAAVFKNGWWNHAAARARVVVQYPAYFWHSAKSADTTIPVLSLDVNNSAGVIAAGTEHPEFTHTGGDVLVWYI